MSNCSCVLVCDDFDQADFYYKTMVKARVSHECYECRSTIEPGDQYEVVKAKWNGADGVNTIKTCSVCLSVRRELFCDGWMHGSMWEDLTEHINYVGTVDSDCLARLTPRARAMVCEIIEETWEDDDD